MQNCIISRFLSYTIKLQLIKHLFKMLKDLNMQVHLIIFDVTILIFNNLIYFYSLVNYKVACLNYDRYRHAKLFYATNNF